MIQVIRRALDIVEYIASDGTKAHKLSEIADHLNLNRGTCANILKTLVDRNYIEQTASKKGYKLGIMIYRLSHIDTIEEELLHAGIEPIDRLRTTLNENCLLAVLRKNNRVAIYQSNAINRDLMVKSSNEKNAFNSASGRFLLACLSDEELHKHLEKYGMPKAEDWPEATSSVKFWEQIKRIRIDGFAKQVTSAHIIGFAYGVRYEGKIIAAVSVYLPLSRLIDHGEKNIVFAVINASLEIEQLI